MNGNPYQFTPTWATAQIDCGLFFVFAEPVNDAATHSVSVRILSLDVFCDPNSQNYSLCQQLTSIHATYLLANDTTADQVAESVLSPVVGQSGHFAAGNPSTVLNQTIPYTGPINSILIQPDIQVNVACNSKTFISFQRS